MDNSRQDDSLPEGAQKRRLSAIMFTDIKGFTSMIETDEATAVGLVKAQREIVRRHIASYGGEERETIGDAFLVIFDSAIKAVRCAIDIQKGIWDYNQKREADKQVWIRIGIHLGDILIEDGSVFGEGINIAARIEQLAEAGGVCVTQQVYDQIRHHIDIKVRRLSVHDLKNVTDIPAVYHVLLPTLAPKGPPTIRERIDEMRESPIKMGIAIGSIALLAAASIYWHFFATHIDFARQVAIIRHEPAARFKISRGDANRLNHYYKITRRGRRARIMEEVRRPESFPGEAKHPWRSLMARMPKQDFPVHEYTYDGGLVKEESIYDQYGILQYKLVYDEEGRIATAHDAGGFIKTFENQIASFGFEFDTNGRMAKIENRNAFGALRSDSQGTAIYRYAYDDDDLPIEIRVFDAHGNPVENKEGIAAADRIYDDKGLLLKETFLDRYNAVHESIRGFAAVENAYDDLGRLVLAKYADRSGQPVMDNDGACARKFGYDGAGRLTEVTSLSCAMSPKATRRGIATTRYEYEGDRVVAQAYMDDSQAPTVDNEGIAAVRIRHDDEGRIAALAYFGIKGQKVLSRDKFHAVNYRYDERGRLTSRTHLDLEEKPTIAAGGYAEARYQYDSRGYATEVAIFDPEGNLVNGRDGYAVLRTKYDQFGNPVSKAFFDRESEPAFGRDEACHHIENKYDDKGDLGEISCYDGKGALTTGIKNCATVKLELDKHGKMVRFECYVDKGKLIDTPNLPSILSIKYDKRGYMSEVRAYDANEELAERFQGAAIWRRVSDEYGNEVEISTYDRNEKLINNPNYRAAIFRRQFDERGNELRFQAFDQDERPTVGIWGYAEIRYSYDKVGHRTSESYFSREEEPAQNWQGVHEMRRHFDEKTGHLMEIANLGVDGRRVADNDGVASIRHSYNEWGWISDTHYFDPEGRPAMNERTRCASIAFKYDDRGNEVEIRCFDVEGNLCKEDECIAIAEQSFDSKGQMIRKIFKDALGNRTANEMGVGGYENEYDLQGRIEREHVIGVDDKHSSDNDGIHEYHLHYKPEMDRSVWFFTFFDTEGRPALSREGAQTRIAFYDPVYKRRQRARVDATFGGRIVRVECLDKAGNVTGYKNCITPREVVDELDRIKTTTRGEATETKSE